MQMTWNFAGVTPAGERAPFFPAGIHLAVISRVEDAKPKEPGAAPDAFVVYFKNHPQHGRPEANRCEARERFGYGEKGAPYVLHLLMAVFAKTADEIAAGFANRPFDPTAPNFLVGQAIYIDARPQSEQDKNDPNRKYDRIAILTGAEAQRLQAERAAGASANAGAASATASLMQSPATAPAVPAASAAPAAPTWGAAAPAAPAGVPPLPGMPNFG